MFLNGKNFSLNTNLLDLISFSIDLEFYKILIQYKLSGTTNATEIIITYNQETLKDLHEDFKLLQNYSSM